MQWEYCSFCGNISLQNLPDGLKKCSKCNWEGIPNTKDMQGINDVARNYKPGSKWAPPIKARQKEVEEIFERADQNNINSNSEPKNQNEPERSSFRMSDEEANKSKNNLDNKTISDKVPSNQELVNRLKGKNFKGADFL